MQLSKNIPSITNHRALSSSVFVSYHKKIYSHLEEMKDFDFQTVALYICCDFNILTRSDVLEVQLIYLLLSEMLIVCHNALCFYRYVSDQCAVAGFCSSAVQL